MGQDIRFSREWSNLVFGLFRAVPVFSGVNGRDGDGDDEGLAAVEIGVAFGQDVDSGEVIFAELVGEDAEPPAQHHHVSGLQRKWVSPIMMTL